MNITTQILVVYCAVKRLSEIFQIIKRDVMFCCQTKIAQVNTRQTDFNLFWGEKNYPNQPELLCKIHFLHV